MTARDLLRSVGVAAVAAVVLVATAGRADVLYEGDSAYSHITVREDGGRRCLYLGRNKLPGLTQSCIHPGKLDEAALEYTQLVFAGLALVPSPRRVLVVGLGGGVIPAVFGRHLPAVAVDVVEVDARVVDVSRKYFEFTDRPGQRVIVEDGRVFIASTRDRYDLVILDAFLSDYIPFHLMTVEFLKQVRRVLTPNGAVVANVFFTNRLFDAQLRTYEEVFGRDLHVFKARYGANAMIVASPAGRKLSLDDLLAATRNSAAAKALPFDVAAEVGKLERGVTYGSGTVTLTDDRAPVNSLSNERRR